MRAVQITEWGSMQQLEVRELPDPQPGQGEVRVRVRAAGLNPVDWKIVELMGGSANPGFTAGIELPAGNGNDFAGEVDALGAGVTSWQFGDLVFGGARFFAQAEFVVAPADSLLLVPEGLSLEQAGALDVVGRTARASVRAVDPKPGETVLVSAAAGGVGVLAAQLAVAAGARVLGTASESNHEFLRRIGVEPVAYGDGLEARVRALAPEGVDAVLDNQGRATLELAVALGVPMSRVNTIAEHGFAAEIGASSVGGQAASAVDLAEVAAGIAAGELVFPIEATYPLDAVREAYVRLKAGHLRGKLVLLP